MIPAIILATVALALFIWLLLPESKSRSSATGTEQRSAQVRSEGGDHSLKVGVGTGVMGGDIEDAAVARYALSRTPKDPKSSDERDLGTALGMQNIDF